MKRKTKQHKVLPLLILSLFYVYILLIFVIAWTPGDKLPTNLPNNFATSFHFCEFFGLAIITFLWCFFILKERLILKFFCVGTGIALLTEIGQIWIPGRAYAPNDLLANFAGFLMIPAIILIVLEVIMYKIGKEEKE